MLTHSTQQHMVQKRVLIVDDSRTTLQVMQVYLMGQDFDFKVAHSAEDAVELFKTWRAHLVITDVNMPGANGIELCTKLKQLARVPVIIVTSKLTPETRMAALRAGADGVLPKPLDSDKLTYMANVLLAN